MVKKIFTLAVMVFLSISMYADLHKVGSYVFSNNARYKITGANLVTNGTFSEGADCFSGWNAINAEAAPLTATFLKNVGMGPDGTNTAQVQAGATALTNGMYQVIPVSVGGTYVVSMKVMNTAGAGFTDLDFTGGNTNYINAFYNTDGALGGVDACGENGVVGGYGFSYRSDAWTEAVFPIEAPAEGNIVIEFAGLAEGLEIAQVECHKAKQVFDTRVSQRTIDYYKTILNGFNFTGYDYYDDLCAAISEMEKSISTNNDALIESIYEDLTSTFEKFAARNLYNAMNSINGAYAENYSANWDKWTIKYNKCSSEAANAAAINGWAWTTDRWSHRTAATNTPLQIRWMRSASGTWDNIAYNTTKLSAGTYYFGVSGEGGMMTLNKNRWTRSLAQECAETQMFIDKAEAFRNAEGNVIFAGSQETIAANEQFGNYFSQIDTLYLNPSYSTPYLYKFVVENDDTEVIFGIRCNIGLGLAASNGFDVAFTNPVLYKVLEPGKLHPLQEEILKRIDNQMAEFTGLIKKAKTLIADNQKKQPWGKAELKAKVEEAQKRYDVWIALTQVEKLEMIAEGTAKYETTNAIYEYKTLDALIVNAGIRFLNNEGIVPFNVLNAPMTDMPGVVAAATATMNERCYSSCDNTKLKVAIERGCQLYASGLNAYSEETAKALVDQKAAIIAATDAFTASLYKYPIVDIDFGSQNVPAEIGADNTIVGKKGKMQFIDYYDSNSFEMGYNNTDSLGMLRVGNGEASVSFNIVPTTKNNTISVDFDMYYGSLSGKMAGYKILTESDDIICGLYCSKYNGSADLNTFDVDFNGKITTVGSSSASNAAIAAESNRTHFHIVIDYGLGKMYCTTSGSKGTAKTEEIDFDTSLTPAKFVVYSDYNNQDRRCWFDNLKIGLVECKEIEPYTPSIDTTPFKPFVYVEPTNSNIDIVLPTIKPEERVYVIADGKTFCNYSIKTNCDITYTRTFNNTSWQPLYVPFELSYSDWKDDFEIAYVNNFHQYDTNEDGIIDKAQMEIIKVKNGGIYANRPYLIKAKTTGEKTMTLNNATLYKTETKSVYCASATTRYNFTGTYDEVKGLKSKGYYIMSGGALCQVDNDEVALKPFRWYMEMEDKEGMVNYGSGSRAKIMSIEIVEVDEDAEATGVISTESEELAGNNAVYDMSGRKVAASYAKALSKGMYIINNKVTTQPF